MAAIDDAVFNDRVGGVRDKEFPMLKGQTYLDHAGTTLYAKSLVERFAVEMTSNLFGNPHSASASSQTSMARVEDVRLRVLQFFNADPTDFDLIFVANATAGVKLITEAFRGAPAGFEYVYHEACHTSLVGVREEAVQNRSVDTEAVEAWIHGQSDDPQTFASNGRPKLFAYPAQSNMDGHRYPLDWSHRLRARGAGPDTNVFTLLDVASYAATSPFDLQDSQRAPDFAVLSFYKLFGFPDLGGVIVRREAAPIFRNRRYFGGGTVDMVASGKEGWHAPKSQSLHDALEDGSLPVHSITALDVALDVFKDLFESMQCVSVHTSILSQRMRDQLSSLRHANGVPVCMIYSPDAHNSSLGTGPIIAFNVRNDHGAWISPAEFERLASIKGFHIRTGGLCNPGGVASALKLQPWEIRRNFSAGFRCGSEDDIIGGKPAGLIRASLGAMSTRSDVDDFCAFVREFYCVGSVAEKGESSALSAQSPPSNLFVADVIVYPIKSCGGYRVPTGSRWDVRPEGLAWDREWCLLHKGSSQALNQKRYPRMALIRPIINFGTGNLEVSYVGQPQTEVPQSISVPLWANPALFSPSTASKGVASRVCGDFITAQTYASDAINEFFSTILEVPCALARFPAGGSGNGMRHAKAHLQRHQHVSRAKLERSPSGSLLGIDTPPDSDTEAEQQRRILLSNESPILAISTASLEALNRNISSNGSQPVSADVFRANIIIGYGESGECPRPFFEDFWSKLKIGTQEFELLGSCRRCHMVCIDQETAEKSEEPFVTLTKTRRFDGKVFFGVHMCHKASASSANHSIQLGETVLVDSTW